MVKAKPLPLLPVDDALPANSPSGIGLTEMADDDLSVARLYRALATRHDELVDYVMDQLKRQAK
jgi:hypothetical protein